MQRAALNGIEVQPTGDGHEAMDNVARAFWQSRAGLADPPELVDINELVKGLSHASD